jgi:hypothetical protein
MSPDAPIGSRTRWSAAAGERAGVVLAATGCIRAFPYGVRQALIAGNDGTVRSDDCRDQPFFFNN